MTKEKLGAEQLVAAEPDQVRVLADRLDTLGPQ
jgi:hypothetical protein